MKSATITIVHADGPRTHALKHVPGSHFAEAADGEVPCPACDRKPLRVVATHAKPTEDDLGYLCRGWCADCEEALGDVDVRAETIFGVAEDLAVLENRPRVYG